MIRSEKQSHSPWGFWPTVAFGLVVLALLPICIWSQASPRASVPQRNVLLLVSDDQGRDMLGCYGNPVIRTTNQDRFAAEGVRFTNAFATVASCSPSRAVLLTGLHNHTSGQYGLAHAIHNFSTFEDIRSLPRLLKEQGYRTGLIGKLHVKPESVYPFDYAADSGWQVERDVAAMARQARDFFAAKNERPFFLLVGYGDPHREGQGLGNSGRNEWKSFANERDYAGIEKITYKPSEVRVPPFLPDQPEVRAELAQYYEAVSRLDQGIGLMLKALEETGHKDDTLVIYLSDNGIPFPGAKTNLYDSGLHLPLLIRAPGLGMRGGVNQAMVSWADITPTILDWAGAKTPPNLAGRSLLPILGQSDPPGWDEIYASHTFHEITMYYPMRAVRTRRYKLIWNLNYQSPFPQADDLFHSPTWQGILRRKDKMMGARPVGAFQRRPEYELYDLERDPAEIRNLAADPAHAKVVAELRAKLHKMMEKTRDPWVIYFQR